MGEQSALKHKFMARLPGSGEQQRDACWEPQMPSSGYRGPWSFSALMPPP